MSKNAPSILIVDDDADQRELLSAFLRRQGYATRTAADGRSALAHLTAEPIALMVSDVRMPGMNGLELLRRARQEQPELPVLIVTAYADLRDAVGAMRDGAANYLEKPIDLDHLAELVAEVAGGPALPVVEPLPPLPPGVIAASPAMKHVLRTCALVAPYDSRVLITGETGTGKEVVARLLHQWSARRDCPLVCVNCAAIPETLLESELFGHEKGAFTGAVNARAGHFAEADGGTILLDEIAEISPPLQAKLLRITQDGSFHRLGSSREQQAHVRLLAATNRNLQQEVAAGRFREDLFYRLNVIEVHLPPLRERGTDILPLAQHFARHHRDGAPRLSPAAAAALCAYGWPGNVRELQNALERAVLMSRGGVILPEHLPERVTAPTAADDAGERPAAGQLREVEQALILQSLREHAYNRTETAKALGISRRALINKLHRLAEAGHQVSPE